MDLTRIITTAIVAVATAFAPIHIMAVKPVQPSDTNTVDHRPFLKRLFKDFPTLYTDTAYTNDSYIVVIRAVLLNNKWHRHHSETKISLPADSDSTESNNETIGLQRPMVKFKKAH